MNIIVLLLIVGLILISILASSMIRKEKNEDYFERINQYEIGYRKYIIAKYGNNEFIYDER